MRPPRVAVRALFLAFALSEHACRCEGEAGGAGPAARDLLRLLEDAGLYPALCRDRPPPVPAPAPPPADPGDPRARRDTAHDNTGPESPGRIRTGDTILNIRGALRDAIGDARAAPSPAPRASRVDALVIRPSQRQLVAPPPAPRRSDRRDESGGTERRTVVAARARVRLLCDLHNVTDVVWFKDGERVVPRESAGGDGGPRLEGAALVVERATRSDAGVWRCAGADRSGARFTGSPITLTLHEAVRGVWLAVDGRRLDAGNTWVPVRENTPLEVLCIAEGGEPPPELSWRVWPEPAPDRRLALRHHPSNHSTDGVRTSRVAITAARELHNATLECEAIQPTPVTVAAEEEQAEPPTRAPVVVAAAKLQMHVTYPPSFVISRWPGFGVALRVGAAAALRCDVDANPPVGAWWQRDGHDPPSSPTPVAGSAAGLEDEEGAGRSATLRWASLVAAHAGWYRCRAAWNHTHYSSIGYYLNVISDEDIRGAEENGDERDEAATSDEVRGAAGAAGDGDVERQTMEVPLGGTVQLHCPKGSVGCWSRRVVGGAAAPDEWVPAGSRHAHGVLGIKGALYEEGGEYRCVGARPPDLHRLRELKRVSLRVTGGAQASSVGAAPAGGGWRLECAVCGRDVRARWLLPSGRWAPAALVPDLHQHCWRTALHVTTPDEVWCVAQSAEGGGAVAVFEARGASAPAQHAPRALAAAAGPAPLAPLRLVLPAALGVALRAAAAP